jgi:hypothetical protein
MREFPPTMNWLERLVTGFDARKVNRAEVGRELGITGPAVTMKLQGKRPIFVNELQVFARFAGMSVAEALGDDAVVIEVRDEMELVELYRLMTPEQRQRWVAVGKDVVGPRETDEEAA